MKKIFTTLLALAVMTAAFSQVQFEENFDDGQADLRWNIGETGGPNTSDFFFDYVAAGIPAAPYGGGLGLKLEANISDGVASQIYAFPKDQSFSPPYVLAFDLWMATDTTGSGTTEFGIFGVMHTDEVIPSNNGVDYTFTGENGSARDIRVYEEGVELLATDGEGGYRLGPDGAMLQNMNLEEGLSVYQTHFEGTMPFGQWLKVFVIVTDTELTWMMNDSIWSQMPNIVNEDGNITLGYMDLFSSVADPYGSMFGLYDNVRVTTGDDPYVGVEDKSISEVSVYPNPVSDYLTVELNERSTLDLVNTLGQVVYSRELTAGKSMINIQDVKEGIYFARFTLENGAVDVHKLVVQ